MNSIVRVYSDEGLNTDPSPVLLELEFLLTGCVGYDFELKKQMVQHAFTVVKPYTAKIGHIFTSLKNVGFTTEETARILVHIGCDTDEITGHFLSEIKRCACCVCTVDLMNIIRALNKKRTEILAT